MEIKNLIGLSKPLTKLFELIATGIGKLYEPTHIKRLASAKAYEINTISTAIANSVSLPTTYDCGTIRIDSNDVKELISRAQVRTLFQEVEKQKNIESVIGKAYKELENEEDVSPDPVEKDWILRFFKSIEDISDEKMQQLWARILAGEIKSPKSFSLRTLAALKNMTQEEALIFEKITQCTIAWESISFIPTFNYCYKQYCSFEELLRLSECGLLNIKKLQFSEDLTPPLEIFTIGKNFLIKASLKESKSFSVAGYDYTNTGREISRIISVKHSKKFVCQFIKYIQARNPQISFSLHQLINDQPATYSDINLLDD